MSPKIHWDIEQGTPEWNAMRAGKWGSSKANVIMGGLTTDGLANLIKDVAWGRVFGPPDDGYRNAIMERGSLMEPESRDWYAFERRVVIREAGLVEHATAPHVTWSPDGLIEPGGAIEAKSPLHKAWMECKRTGLIPSEYRWQCRWAMWVGELEYLDFVSYHPLAGGLIVPATVTEAERQQMAERVDLLEKKVAEWVEIISEKKAA
jgi:hypothetical protein